MNNRITALTLRIVGVIAVILTLAAITFLLLEAPALTPFVLSAAAAAFALAGALAVALFGIAALLDQPADAPVDYSPAITQLQEQVASIATRIAARPANPISAPIDSTVAQQLADLQDLILLSDAERQQRAAERKQSRARDALTVAAVLIDRRDWIQADRAIAEVEQSLPDFPSALQMRERFAQAHAAAEAETFAAAQAEVESEMSRGHWNEADAIAQSLLADFPGSADAARLAARVQRERGIYTETTVQRLFDEIRHESERRQWRRALVHAQELLGKFPEHARAEHIRQQLHTMQQNAEIEERHELETRISDMVRSRRFDDAIEVAEEVIRRFPLSPQAETITKLLPRLRAMKDDHP